MTENAKPLDGKRVLVVGGATGIGFAISELASDLGAAVVIGSRNEANVNRALKRIAGATGHTVNLREEDSVAKLFGKIRSFDHLAITAGDWDVPMFVSTQDIDVTQAREIFAVRFWGALAAVKHAAGHIAQSGSITLTSGMLAHRPMKGAPLAAAMAGAVEHLARGLAVDLAPVRVNAVCPGLILSEYVMKMPEATRLARTALLPVPRGGTPAEAAKAFVYLMLNDYVTGQILAIDGGGLLV